MLSVLLPATRRSPAVVDIRAELAGRTECRKTPNLSFHPPTVPLARWIKKEDALEALAKEGTRLRLSALPRASPESREALQLYSGRPNSGFWLPQVWALDAPSVGSPILGDEEHSQYFLPLPLPLPLPVLPSPLPPFGGPQVFEDEADGFEKQLSLLWPGF